jgi:hypothetical protein
MVKQICVLIFVGISVNLISQDIQQSVIATAGDFNEWENGSISWTLGEVIVATYTNDNTIITQGFQQGNLHVISIVEESIAGFTLKAYPNPVADLLTVEFNEESLDYQVVDQRGKVIQNGTLHWETYMIDFTSIAPGTYFLVVEKRKTHKIIKN